VVPALKGKKLAVAKKKLKAADCTLGKVKGKKTKSAKVSKQSPAPGKTFASGAKVNVTVN
jgi:beta-lactam-binding protein with PASTA domain